MKAGTMVRTLLSLWLTMMMLLAGGSARAQDGNAIETITASQQGANLVVRIAMTAAPAALPAGFAISSPPRIALDFGAIANRTGKIDHEFGVGDLRSVNVVQAGDRARLLFNLNRSLGYTMAIDGKAVVVTIDTSAGVATAPAAPADRPQLRAIDFRRGDNGEGRVVVELPRGAAADVRQTPTGVVVDFIGAGAPEALRRRLDVGDFGTPVTFVSTAQQGDHARMTIEARGVWEQSVYQSDTQLVVDVRPVKEDPNRVSQGTQGYRGEKLSFNFQNLEVRAALQAVADISGLNIITSDSVTGNLTLRLKDVPWDQALDVILHGQGPSGAGGYGNHRNLRAHVQPSEEGRHRAQGSKVSH